MAKWCDHIGQDSNAHSDDARSGATILELSEHRALAEHTDLPRLPEQRLERTPPAPPEIIEWDSGGVDAIEFMIQSFGFEDVQSLREPEADPPPVAGSRLQLVT